MEHELLSKPRQMWNNALRAVKGENTQELVEAFTSEMTLVAEGLCEDQNKLRAGQQELADRVDKVHNHLDSELQALEQELQEQRRDTDARLDALEKRLEAIEKSLSEKKTGRASKYFSGGMLNQITVIVGIAAGSWVLVTILNLFR